MSMTDPISDLICRINNAQTARLRYVDIPKSKIKEQIIEVLLKEGYVSNYEEKTDSSSFKSLRVFLRYASNAPVIKEFKRISKPGRRVYSNIKELPQHYGGLGVSILSTSKGILTDHDARLNNVGGEVICSLF